MAGQELKTYAEWYAAVNESSVLALEDTTAYLRTVPYVSEAAVKRFWGRRKKDFRFSLCPFRGEDSAEFAWRQVRLCKSLDEVMTHLEAASIGCGFGVFALVRAPIGNRTEFFVTTADTPRSLADHGPAELRDTIVYLLESALYQHRAMELTFGKILTGCSSKSLAMTRGGVLFDNFEKVTIVTRFTDPSLGSNERAALVDRILAEHFDETEAAEIKRDLVAHVAPYGLLAETSASAA